MDRQQKLELLQRSLGLKHKIKVHDSMKPAETHEDLAVTILAKWEFEDELKAIDEILADARGENVKLKRASIEKEGYKPKKSKK